MDTTQRTLIFLVASAAIWLGWTWLNPPPAAVKKPANQEAVAQADDDAEPPQDEQAGADAAADGDEAGGDDAGEAPADNAGDAGPEIAAAEDEKTDQPPVEIPKFPRKIVHIGSDDPESGYRFDVALTTRGAAIESIALNDPRYRSLKNPQQPLKVIGDIDGGDLDVVQKAAHLKDELTLRVEAIFREHCYKCHAGKKPSGGFRINTRQGLLAGSDTGGQGVVPGNPENSLIVEAIRWQNPNFKMPPKGPQLSPEEINDVVQWIEIGAPLLTPVTLQTKVPQIESQFAKANQSLNSVDWELVSRADDGSQAVFRMTAPDGSVEITKTYKVNKVDGDKPEALADAYVVDFDLSIKNLTDKPQTVNYELQGPVGVPLENSVYARRWRDVQFGYTDPESGKFVSETLTAQEIVDGETTLWVQPLLNYLGVDVQYFAAFVQPAKELTLEDSYFRDYTQFATHVDDDHPERSGISVAINSRAIELQPGETATHEYNLFAGPKRKELLEPRGAEAILDLGWFGPVAKVMLWLLDKFHAVIPNYGVAIIILTVLVRLSMFPLSRKQALGAAKMQAIKPEIDALKKKYGDDREKMGRAQMELFRKHNYNPFSGCLVLFVQMPVFFGLYTALRSSVDLRMAPFLWIKNLAAPDALFQLPFDLPFSMGDTFNLLPIITVALFIVQQKMFMPPPTDEQSAMQAKMMQYMVIFMGFMFYSVPAGLCVYFISSSLWGIGERKLLPKVSQASGGEDGDGGSDAGDAGPGSPSSGATQKAAPKQGAAKRKSRPRR